MMESTPAPTHNLESSALSAQTVVGNSTGTKTSESVIYTSTSPGPSPTATRFVDTPNGQSQDSPSPLPPYIPYDEPNRTRTLVACFDGTGDQFDADNSNIVQLVSMLKKDDKSKQMVYYQAGIGTYTSPTIATPFMSKISKLLDEMLAWNINAHVMGGYEFLMQNYMAGDRICIFGFSRGAYTARSLAGMIHKVGLLPADNFQQIPFAYKMYTRTDSVGWDQSNAFKKAFSVDVPIHFVGVWDTVDSVGLIPKRLPFTTSNTIVQTFRHAVSLDEHRSKFKANLWNRPSDEEQKLDLMGTFSRINERLHDHQHADDSHKRHQNDEQQKSNHEHKEDPSNDHSRNGNGEHAKKLSNRGATIWKLDNKSDNIQNHFESLYSNQSDGRTDIDEVWFAGCHCDVGGGSVANGTRYSLARIPLRWMVRECFKTKTGILFKTESLREIGLDPHTIYPYVISRPPAHFERAPTQVIEKIPSMSFLEKISNFFMSTETRMKIKHAEMEKRSAELKAFISEEDEELRDALSPKYDQLKIKWFWWILEILPVSMRYQRGNDQWVSYIGINLGRSRIIPKQKVRGVKVHRSVKLRMVAQCADKEEKYQPKAEFKVEPTWVD